MVTVKGAENTRDLLEPQSEPPLLELLARVPSPRCSAGADQYARVAGCADSRAPADPTGLATAVALGFQPRLPEVPLPVDLRAGDWPACPVSYRHRRWTG